jgi:hypothetical protein
MHAVEPYMIYINPLLMKFVYSIIKSLHIKSSSGIVMHGGASSITVSTSNLSLLAGLQDSHVLEESTPFATTIPLRQPLYQTSENS